MQRVPQQRTLQACSLTVTGAIAARTCCCTCEALPWRPVAVARTSWAVWALRRSMRTLTLQLQAGERALDDWSIGQTLRCTCELCKLLKRYLSAKKHVVLEWPLAENDRSHIEAIIRSENLPVRHSLRRKGRPYTLVLEKTPELFRRAVAERRSRVQDHQGALSHTGWYTCLRVIRSEKPADWALGRQSRRSQGDRVSQPGGAPGVVSLWRPRRLVCLYCVAAHVGKLRLRAIFG